MKKSTAIVLATVVLVIGAVVGHVFTYRGANQIASASPIGSTFSGQAAAATIISISAPTGTSTSILNTDSNDRIITQVQGACSGLGTSFTAYTGTGLANLTFKGATTSTAAPSSVSNTNNVLNMNIPTSTAEYVFSSTTPAQSTAAFTDRWASGSYLTFYSNATNTAVCTLGVQYIGN